MTLHASECGVAQDIGPEVISGSRIETSDHAEAGKAFIVQHGDKQRAGGYRWGILRMRISSIFRKSGLAKIELKVLPFQRKQM